MDYTPLKPEEDENLQSNPHYWLYKVTREALDNENHPLHDMGHIWNRWACEGLSEEEAKELSIDLNDYLILRGYEKRKIKKEINNEIIKFGVKNIDWDFPKIDSCIDFKETTWRKDVNFIRFIFIPKAIFYNTTFEQNVNFEQTKFIEEADFRDVTFTKNANFRRTTFTGNADFKHSKFKQNADFSNSTFKQTVDFSKSEFMGDVIKFNECKFLKPTNDNTEFDFKNAIFATKVNFSESEFHHLPNLTGTDFRAGINLDEVKFPRDLSPPPLGEGWVGDTIIESGGHNVESVTVNPPPNLPQRGRDNIVNPPPSLPQGGRDKENILGGLPPSDAERTWRTFSSEMEKAGNHEEALEYFGLALDAKQKNPQTDILFKFILWLYKAISDYGKSLARPFTAWCFLICAFFSIYSPIIFSNTKTLLPYYALKFALKGSIPFISDQTTFFDRMFDEQGANVIPKNNTLELFWFPFLYGVHTLLSLILIFLFGLGVRNRLRLK